MVIIGVLLGGKFGICTIATVLLSSPIIQATVSTVKKSKILKNISKNSHTSLKVIRHTKRMEFDFEPAAILGTFVFRGFFMPEYCFLRRYSSKVSAFFAKFLLYFSRCTRSELLCRCHSFRLTSQDFSGLCSRRYIRAFPTICRCQRQTIPHRLRRKIQAYRI